MSIFTRAAILIALTTTVAVAQDDTLRNRMDPREDLTTSGQPTVESLENLADSGFAAIIDLRRPEEDRGIDEQAAVEGLGMSYVSLPIDGADGVNFENADALNQLLAEIDGPVLVHCGSGNRAGAVLALAEKLNGADNEKALQFGREAGLRGLEPTVRERLENESSE